MPGEFFFMSMGCVGYVACWVRWTDRSPDTTEGAGITCQLRADYSYRSETFRSFRFADQVDSEGGSQRRQDQHWPTH